MKISVKPLPLICHQNKTIILNLTLSNFQISVLEIHFTLFCIITIIFRKLLYISNNNVSNQINLFF